MTDIDLINALTADLRPAPPNRTERDMALAVGAGAATSIAALIGTFGIQSGLDGPAMVPLAMKEAYGLALAILGGGATLHLSRPGAMRQSIVAPVTAVIALLGGLAAIQLATLDRSDFAEMIAGSTWHWCSLRIVALALPVFGAIIMMLRRQAPVRPRRAGAAAGLVAGALASSIYALACVEHSAAFVFIWYTSGIAAMSAIGWFSGPKLLRW